MTTGVVLCWLSRPKRGSKYLVAVSNQPAYGIRMCENGLTVPSLDAMHLA
jgi:hypothetical protein